MFANNICIQKYFMQMCHVKFTPWPWKETIAFSIDNPLVSSGHGRDATSALYRRCPLTSEAGARMAFYTVKLSRLKGECLPSHSPPLVPAEQRHAIFRLRCKCSVQVRNGASHLVRGMGRGGVGMFPLHKRVKVESSPTPRTRVRARVIERFFI